MNESDIVTVPYFVYDSGYPWAEICLKDQDVLNMLKRIEEGASPFDVIPRFRKDIFQLHMERSFPFGRFETRPEIHFNERIFGEKISPEQVGRLLVPHYNVMTRSTMNLRRMSTGSSSDRNLYDKTLLKNIDAESFYSIGIRDWRPLDVKEVFILSEKQLE